MTAEIKTIGYIFRVSKGGITFDIMSITELGIGESNKIIRDFFNNFKILKGDRIVKTVETKENETKDGDAKIDEVSKDGIKTDIEIGNIENTKKVKIARKQREPVKNIWGNLRDMLDDEFTLQEYIKALRDAGYEYTASSWEAVPSQQLKKLIKLGKVEKIEGDKPGRSKYRKIKVPLSIKSDKEIDKVIKSLKDGKKAIMGTIK